MPAYGLAAAATILIGQAIGRKDQHDIRRIKSLVIRAGVGIMSLLGLILYIGAPLFASLFTSDREAIEQIVTALRIDAFAQPALAIGLIMAGVFQGLGDTKTPLYTTLFGMWVVRILGILLLSLTFHLGIAGVWLAIALDLSFWSLVLCLTVNKRLEKELMTGN